MTSDRRSNQDGGGSAKESVNVEDMVRYCAGQAWLLGSSSRALVASLATILFVSRKVSTNSIASTTYPVPTLRFSPARKTPLECSRVSRKLFQGFAGTASVRAFVERTQDYSWRLCVGCSCRMARQRATLPLQDGVCFACLRWRSQGRESTHPAEVSRLPA